MNRQEVFDKVATHLLTQKVKSDENGYCMYRGPNGLKCAIGCLIPDDMFMPYFNGCDVNGLPLKIIMHIGARNNEDLLFLSRLQLIHDNHAPNEWKNLLYDFANRNHLAWTCLEPTGLIRP